VDHRAGRGERAHRPAARLGAHFMPDAFVETGVLELFRSADLSLSLFINVALYVAIIALLFAPDTHRALEAAAQG